MTEAANSARTEAAAVPGERSGSEGSERSHEHLDHAASPVHHHHSHACDSRHAHGHHLLTVEDLSISFRMYEEGEGQSRARAYLDAKRREVEVIRSLSISVHEGEIVAVVGASGSGKTLLADAILGLFEPNALVRGHIWYDGAPMDEARAKELIAGFGLDTTEEPAPAPAPAPTPAPAPAPAASAGGTMSQAEIEAMMAGGIPAAPAPM